MAEKGLKTITYAYKEMTITELDDLMSENDAETEEFR